jgi:hypothetical protein
MPADRRRLQTAGCYDETGQGRLTGRSGQPALAGLGRTSPPFATAGEVLATIYVENETIVLMREAPRTRGAFLCRIDG